MALSTAQPMKLLSLCVGLHSYSVKDSTDSQLSFVLVAGLSGLHSHSDFFSPLRPQWSSHIFFPHQAVFLYLRWRCRQAVRGCRVTSSAP